MRTKHIDTSGHKPSIYIISHLHKTPRLGRMNTHMAMRILLQPTIAWTCTVISTRISTCLHACICSQPFQHYDHRGRNSRAMNMGHSHTFDRQGLPMSPQWCPCSCSKLLLQGSCRRLQHAFPLVGTALADLVQCTRNPRASSLWLVPAALQLQTGNGTTVSCCSAR